MSIDLAPQAPARTFTRAVRALVLGYAVVLVALWAWQVLAADAIGPLGFLGTVGGALIGGPTRTVWRWAGRPRLTGGQQRTITDARRGADRRTMSRALRRGEPPPAGLEGWALPYARVQQQLVPAGCALLLMTSASLVPVATAGHLGGWGWAQVAVSAPTFAVGAGLLVWARRAGRTARTWTADTEGAAR